MMSHKRVDQNQKLIVARLRRMGAKVMILSDVGKGFPDLVVGFPFGGDNGRRVFLVEIKNGDMPLSKQKLTLAEQIFHDEWKNFVYTVNSESEAIKLWEEGMKR